MKILRKITISICLFILLITPFRLFSRTSVPDGSGVDIVNSISSEKTQSPLVFRKKMIASESFESVGVFDVNNDGKADIVSGAYWYEGPDFSTRYLICSPARWSEYYNDFSTLALDVDGDGWTDFVTGGWADTEIYWRKNPGNNKDMWKNITIGRTGNIETTRLCDFDGDGKPEIISNNPGNPLKIFQLQLDAQGKGTGVFKEFEVLAKQDHGMGFGDINNDGRVDIILNNGWLEAPQKPFVEKWTFHDEFSLEGASIPIIIADINHDGRSDFITGIAHDYGLFWYEQLIDSNNKRTWKKHPIDLSNSEYHTMEWEDIDNDGNPELITGKRYRAHNSNDPGWDDPIGLYYFKWNGESFTKQVISYGKLGEGKGAGIFFKVVDLDNDGKKDIAVAGKDGLYVFYNEGYKNK